MHFFIKITDYAPFTCPSGMAVVNQQPLVQWFGRPLASSRPATALQRPSAFYLIVIDFALLQLEYLVLPKTFE